MTYSYIISAKRTPIGSLMGALSGFNGAELGAKVLSAMIRGKALSPDHVDELFMGCVLSAGMGQSPARQAVIYGGLPNHINVTTLNKVCSSGLKAVILADQSIRCQDNQLVLAGGMESMSHAPYILPKARQGYRLGHGQLIDSMIQDGLWDGFTDQHMGLCAELCATKYNLTRENLDAFAAISYQRAQAAIDNSYFKDEIVPVSIPRRRQDPIICEIDEEPARVKFDKISALTPSFKSDGVITPANASSIADGAAAFIVASKAYIDTHHIAPMARIVSHGAHAHAPEWFTTAPIDAMKKALQKANLTVADIDLFEINEAFAAVTMAATIELGLDPEKVNVNGGAVALGHPIGASGARILTTLVHALKCQNKRYGMAAICNGGGEGTAIIVENCA